jgi:hypothetical protein
MGPGHRILLAIAKQADRNGSGVDARDRDKERRREQRQAPLTRL